MVYRSGSIYTGPWLGPNPSECKDCFGSSALRLYGPTPGGTPPGIWKQILFLHEVGEASSGKYIQ